MKILTLSLLLVTFCTLSHGAPNGILDAGTLAVKDLIQEALKEGKSEGVVSGGVSAIFQNATHSNEPVTMKITRVKTYEAGCGRLHFEMIQSGVKSDSGKLVQVNPEFELSICPNGMPPKEVKQELDKHRIEALKTCKAKIEKGAQDKDSGATKGVIKLTGCPANGKVQLRYTGACPTIQMPEGQVVNYTLNEKGKLDIELRVPAQCTQENPAQQNQWSLLMIERDGLILGDVATAW